MAATISTPNYLFDQARRRFTPSVNNFPGMGMVERKLRNTQFPEHTLGCLSSGTSSRCCAGDPTT
jgi:hypothetical protein